MTDLNTAIARFKGWTQSMCYAQGCLMWINPDSKRREDYCPDFEHDARLYMALFEEMPNPCIRKYNDEWLCIPEMRHSLVIKSIEEFSKDIGTAICQAYCKIHGLDV